MALHKFDLMSRKISCLDFVFIKFEIGKHFPIEISTLHLYIKRRNNFPLMHSIVVFIVECVST